MTSWIDILLANGGVVLKTTATLPDVVVVYGACTCPSGICVTGSTEELLILAETTEELLVVVA